MTSKAMNLKWPGTGLGLVLGCLGFVAAPRCEAQNLVPNPGFEESDSCSFGSGLGTIHSWYSANNTPDQLKGCQPYGSAYSLPLNLWSFQFPYDGDFCLGLITYHQNGANDEQREWVMAPLLEPLVPGQSYYCSFRANAGFGGNAQYPQIWLANDKVGMLFTTQDRRWDQGDPFPAKPNYAHVLYPDILADTVGWTLVSGSFVADSAYQYLMIGQFFANVLTDTLHFADPNSVFPWYPRGYTMIDAVCVSANPKGCDMGQGLVEGSGIGVLLFPNPAQDELIIKGAIGSSASFFDALGRLVLQDRITADIWTLGVREWQRGMYLLRLGDGKGISVFKFVLTDE